MTEESGMTGCGGGCGVDVTEEGLDLETTRKITKHPCFNKEASFQYGRIHLPVAPDCNEQCNFCLREFDCVNESRPGVTSQVLTPAEALKRVNEVMGKFDNIHTIGIAGPGEPLANEATFETFQLVKDNFEGLHLCVSSNGLLLPDKVDILSELGMDTVTVTMSAVDPKIGEKIYSWIYYDGNYYRELQGAELLLSKQIEGIKLAVEKGMLVKVNSVMIPTVNDRHIVEIAKKAKELGAFMHNIMPLIPQYKFAHLKPPTAQERKNAQDKSAQYIKQMRHCRQCRADAVGLLGKDLNKELFEPKKMEAEMPEAPKTKVAISASEPTGDVDLHFGNTPRFLIYEINGDTYRFLEARDIGPREGKPDLAKSIESIADCKYVITRRAGPHAIKELKEAGIELIEDYSPVETAINRLVKYFMK